MSFNFTYAAELKKRFNCYGHFYSIKFPDNKFIPCRSVLEIVDKNISPLNPDKLWLHKPDAIVIMMNPGSSYPIHPEQEDIRYFSEDFNNLKHLVLTRPDNTQYQIMRVAKEMKWSHVRVLNLSDIRNSKSSSFISQVEDLNKNFKDNIHSIFCAKRGEECKVGLNSMNKNVILGWGQNINLVPLAKICFKRIYNHNIVKVESDVHKFLNAHPSPMLQKKKEEWLMNVIKQL